MPWWRSFIETLRGGDTSSGKSGHLLLLVLRGCFLAVMVSLGYYVLDYGIRRANITTGMLGLIGTLLLGVLIIATDILVRHKQITTISAIYFGLVLGLILGTVLSSALQPIVSELVRQDMGKKEDLTKSQQIEQELLYQERAEMVNRIMHLLLSAICAYVTISTLMQTKDEFRFIIPYVEFSKQVKGNRPLVLDTSVIIDGRIADICDTQFIDTRLIVPRFVLVELQGVADSSDKLKRNRGRRGLDVLKKMQSNKEIDLHIHEANLPEYQGITKVDERLVLLAKSLGARIVTNDFNLNKISQLQGVAVININELANALKSVALPGELMQVKLVKAGDQFGQAVGYLDDGTMVVVEQGRNSIGSEVLIVVTSVLQTPAGRMLFGRIEQRTGSGTGLGTGSGVGTHLSTAPKPEEGRT